MTIVNGKSITKDDKNITGKVLSDGKENKTVFGFFGGKEEKIEKVESDMVRDFDGAIRGIEYFIRVEDFDKARGGIEEIAEKEKEAYNNLLDKISLEKEIKRQEKIYSKKLKRIDKLKDYLDDEEIKYKENQEFERFKVKFSLIKEKLDGFILGEKYAEAIDLISTFYNENSDNVEVAKYYNRQKKILQKKYKKQLAEKEEQLSKNLKEEAEALIGESINKVVINKEKEEEKRKNQDKGFIGRFFAKIKKNRILKKRLENKRIQDDVNLLLETEKEVKEIEKRSKVESMHLGLVKELSNDKLVGYELYAKILGKDKISGDAFGFAENDENYKFFLGDATGHGVKAGIIVTLITRIFYKLARNTFLEKLAFEINNGLKQDLKSGNFITGLVFEINKNNLNYVKYVGMGHEPILVYRKETGKVEKYLSGGLAAGIRIINDINKIKTRDLNLGDGDIIFVYSDGIVESRNLENELLGIDGFKNMIEKVLKQTDDINLIYVGLISALKDFKGGSVNFYDDATIFLLKRDFLKDKVDKESLYLKDLSIKEGLSRKNIGELEGKTKEEIQEELLRIKKEKQMKLILKNLETLRVTGEILKLKQESARYIKEGYISKKINNYLKIAISREKQYKIDLKEQRMKSKYKVLSEMLKKGDFETVIKETQDIISNDGNITI